MPYHIQIDVAHLSNSVLYPRFRFKFFFVDLVVEIFPDVL